MTTVLLILGAGASYDSVAQQPPGSNTPVRETYRPPLARDLFSDRDGVMRDTLGSYPNLAAVAQTVRGAVSSIDIESILARYAARAGDPTIARQLLQMRLYLRDVISACGVIWHEQHRGATNFADLVDLLRGSFARTLVVTFNYDLLFESAQRDLLDIEYRAFADYIRAEKTRLYKLHGSVNWGRVFAQRRDSTIDPKVELLRADAREVLRTVSDSYRISTGYTDPVENLLLPAIAVPLRNKDTFECPDEHTQDLEAQLIGVDRVLAIGWRGGETKFLEMLSKYLRPGIPFDVVSTKDGALQTLTNLQGGEVHGEFRYFDGGFSSFMRDAAAQGGFREHADFAEFETAPGGSPSAEPASSA